MRLSEVAATRRSVARSGRATSPSASDDYYLTGFDTAGYVFFQVGIVTADGRPTALLTRRPDLRQAEVASLYEDVRIWLNAEGANPALDLKAILEELGCAGESVGVEYATYGLTGDNARRVEEALGGVCELVDASDIVRALRLVKSPAELDYVRAAGRLADAAVVAMIEATRPGALDSAVTAAGVAAMLEGGGDMPAGGPLVNSGPRALVGRGIGPAPDRGARPDPRRARRLVLSLPCLHRAHDRHRARTSRAGEHDGGRGRRPRAIRRGRPPRSRARHPRRHPSPRPRRAGFGGERFAACGYSLGATFRPTWMDVPPMIYSGNPLIMAPGMVLFVHIMIPDRRSGLAAGVGQTFIVTNGEADVPSAIPAELHRR